jgi:uracil-DNA glycosylase
MLTVPSNPGKHKLLILGEAPGKEEEEKGQPFVGASGHLLRETLFRDADLDINAWHITNVLTTRPLNNDIKNATLPKTELRRAGLPISQPPLGKRHFLPEPFGEAMATRRWIEAQAFDFILALGGTAQWLLSGDNRIGLFRGTIFKTPLARLGALSTYHPAAILREFKLRPIAWADLIKVRRHLEGTLDPPLRRTFIYNPTWEEMEEAYGHFASRRSDLLGVDIETAPSAGQITTISFATATYAICIPIWNKYGTAAAHNVYPSAAEEARVWRMIDRFARLPNPKVLQNGLYDMQYLLEAPGEIRLRNATEDTNIMHHALEIELPKDLGMLASLYLNEPGWKQMRSKHEEAKAED